MMKTIAREALLEMRGRGFDEEGLGVEYDFDRADVAQEVLERVREVFAGVQLGKGIGLYEAQALDDYASEEVRSAARGRDEMFDWQKITPAQLNQCNSSLSFFDADGMRFHLPSFLCAELRGEYDFGMAFCLTHFEYYGHSQFEKLTPEQRSVVRRFLLFLLDEPDYRFDGESIRESLERYWIG